MSRLGRLFRRDEWSRELDAEIADHIEERTADLVNDGMPFEEALRTARRQFGNATSLAEQSREVWQFPWLETLWRDVKVSLRGMRRTPLFTAVVVTMLAVGIGGSTAMFSVVDSVLLRPLPFPQADRVMMLWEHPPKTVTTGGMTAQKQQNPTSPANFWAWHDRTHSFEAMAAFFEMTAGLSGFGEPRPVDALCVSASLFQVLGVAPLAGRTFSETEDVPHADPVAVVSYRLWRGQFGGDPSVVGRSIRLNEEPHRIIGIMPEGFDLPFQHADVWVPIGLARDSKNGRYLSVIAKLRPGVSQAAAQEDLSAVARQIAVERPATNRDWGTGIVSLYDQTTADVRPMLVVLFGAVTFVLLIAAGNVANLLMMRMTQRRQEMAVRAALGAGRRRIAMQLVAESLVLSLAGGACGVALAALAVRAISASSAAGLPRIDGVQLDGRVLAFSAILCLGTTLLFGLVPAWRSAGENAERALREGGPRGTAPGRRIRSALVMVEVALSVVLLAGAGLLARSFRNEMTVHRGFRTDHILTMRLFFAPARYHDGARRARYLNDILDRVRAVPGVEGASSVQFLPMVGMVSGSGFWRLDRPAPGPGLEPSADFVTVSPGYFALMGIPLLSGRDFSDADTLTSEPGIIVNQTFARRFFPGEEATGHRLALEWNVTRGRIIGVVADARQTDLKVAPEVTIFLDQAQVPMYGASVVVRTALPPQATGSAVARKIHEVDPDQAIERVESMDQVVADSVAQPRLASLLLGGFAGVALLLAAVGLYGVLAYSVSQRTREIGIRMAMGARPGQLVGGVVRDGMRLIVPGMAAGLGATLMLTRVLESLLFEVRQNDPATLATAIAVLLAAGMLASWVPARRAAGMDPVRSLRVE